MVQLYISFVVKENMVDLHDEDGDSFKNLGVSQLNVLAWPLLFCPVLFLHNVTGMKPRIFFVRLDVLGRV